NADIILKSGSTTKSLSNIVSTNGTMCIGAGAGSTQRSGSSNDAAGAYSTVSGGCNNYAGASYSIVGGGRDNCNSGSYSTINGGCKNHSDGGQGNTILGGDNNCTSSVSTCSTVGGGLNNRTANGYSTIIGGAYNDSLYTGTVVGGGCRNIICNSSTYSGILGGYCNKVCHTKSFVIGVDLCSNANCRTFVNSMNVAGLDGSICASNGVLVTTSDERLKNLCGEYCDGYCIVEKIVPVQYDWKDETLNSPGKINIGFTAQNVKNAIPEAVTENKKGFYNLDTTPILASLINTTKEHNKKILKLRKKLAELKGESPNLIDTQKRDNLKKVLMGGAIIGAGMIGLSKVAKADVILKSGGNTETLTNLSCSTLMCVNGTNSTERDGNGNSATGSYSTISGGANSQASDSYSTVGGGNTNFALGTDSTVSGGKSGLASGCYSAVGGGGQMGNCASGAYSTVLGGIDVRATNTYSTASGYLNYTKGCSSTIIGGSLNNICTTAHCSGILGGTENKVCHSNSFIVGSNLCTNASCRTFVNSLNLEGLSGTITASSGVLTTSSDERLKNICGEYCDGYGVIKEIQPVKFDWKDKVLNKSGRINIGFTAQNVQNVIPDAVAKNKEGYYSLDNTPVLAALVNTTKEHNKRIKDLEKRFSKIKK
ncbi:MAG: hypothetical protein HN878_04285, partial [Candidatus Diapherotrites archaeon]|nr:hypothetical protein [Candidatus Diapherotrites archaeon]